MFASKPIVIPFLLAIAVITLATPGLPFHDFSAWPSTTEWYSFENFSHVDNDNPEYVATAIQCSEITARRNMNAFTWDESEKKCFPLETEYDPYLKIRLTDSDSPISDIITQGFDIPTVTKTPFLKAEDITEHIRDLEYFQNQKCTFLYEDRNRYSCVHLQQYQYRFVLLRRF